jgi:hypothetical protein
VIVTLSVLGDLSIDFSIRACTRSPVMIVAFGSVSKNVGLLSMKPPGVPGLARYTVTLTTRL